MYGAALLLLLGLALAAQAQESRYRVVIVVNQSGSARLVEAVNGLRYSGVFARLPGLVSSVAVDDFASSQAEAQELERLGFARDQAPYLALCRLKGGTDSAYEAVVWKSRAGDAEAAVEALKGQLNASADRSVAQPAGPQAWTCVNSTWYCSSGGSVLVPPPLKASSNGFMLQVRCDQFEAGFLPAGDDATAQKALQFAEAYVRRACTSVDLQAHKMLRLPQATLDYREGTGLSEGVPYDLSVGQVSGNHRNLVFIVTCPSAHSPRFSEALMQMFTSVRFSSFE